MEEYYEDDYEGLKVIKMKVNEYINATKYFQDNNKSFVKWHESRETKILINELSAFLGVTDVVIKITLGPNIYRGCYVHPKLMIHIIMSLSPSNAITKINQMEMSIAELTDEISKLSLEKNIATNDRVVKTKHTNLFNAIVICQNTPNEYRIFRGQRRYINKAVRKYLEDKANSVIFAEIEYNPNAVNYYARFKETLKGKISWTYNTFTLITINTNQLKEYIQQIDAEKYLFN
jgi:hypothetical protein